MKQRTIGLFVPHLGCPQQCSFCDQTVITGKEQAVTPQQVKQAIDTALQTSSKHQNLPLELAFYGGSFTAIPWQTQKSLLDVAQPYLQKGSLTGVRLSTRPDAIDEAILKRLKNYGVTTIELGVQSMCDKVLAVNRRGHTVQDVMQSSHLIQKHGLQLGLQMMVGLPQDTEATAIQTAYHMVSLSPDFVRIYPALVFPNTAMAKWYQVGSYQPLSLAQAVRICSHLLCIFQRNKIPVVRLGLHDSPAAKNTLAGPYHPAFGELCYSAIFLRNLQTWLQHSKIPKGQIQVRVAPSQLSCAIGQHGYNRQVLANMGYLVKFVPDVTVPVNSFSIASFQTR